MTVEPKLAFDSLPETLTQDLLDAYAEVVTNYAERRWEPSELNGGKLCEAAFTVVEGFLNGGKYAPRATKPRNFQQACDKLAQSFPGALRSPRIQIPRMLVALYEIRNNRGVGHAGGEVSPNEMDATAVLYMSKWIMAELVRLLHNLSTTDASDLVEMLVEREIAVVWRWGGKRRVLQTGLTWRQQVLLLLAGVTETSEDELVAWLEHKTPRTLRRDVLRPMHKDRLIDFDETTSRLRLLPPGIARAEELLQASEVA